MECDEVFLFRKVLNILNSFSVKDVGGRDEEEVVEDFF